MAAELVEVTGLDELTALVTRGRQELDVRSGAAMAVATQGQAAVARMRELEHRVEVHQQVTLLLTRIGEERQETARKQVEELASRAMQVIFGQELSFHLVAGERGGQATLEFMVRSAYDDGDLETPVMDARGGGMVAVLGFVMRLVVLLLTDGVRKILVLDESFAMVSVGYEARVAEFLSEVAHRAQVQIILVTHSPEYAQHADQKYRFAQAGGVTKVFPGESE